MNSVSGSRLGQFAIRHAISSVFIAVTLCVAGVFAALHMPSSVFPQTDFPRVVVLVNNGIMPTDEMMATVTRPIEEAMKELPGATSVRSSTKRGSAEIHVFFNWQTDMQRSELYVLGKLAQIRSDLPATAETEVERITFSAFPILGLSLTSSKRDVMELWETANYKLKPLFLQIPGVAKVDLVGGHVPEYHVIVDPFQLQAQHLSLADVADAVRKNNFIAPAGTIEQNYHLYLTTVDGRVAAPDDLGGIALTVHDHHPVLLRDVARIERGPAPAYTDVTAQGRNAVLLNIQAQPEGSILDIAKAVTKQIHMLKRDLPADMHLDFYYDQSQFVRDSVRSVWDAILFGLMLSVVILFLFLKNWGSVLTAIVTIPVSVLITVVAMRWAGMSFNMMTLGGIAASIGLIIDDAIVVVEAMAVKLHEGRPRAEAIQSALGEIVRPLVASTLTPVVVFIPLAFLLGVPGVFFRALALTMVVSLLMSLVLALTLTPSLAGWLLRGRENQAEKRPGFLLPRVMRVYEWAVRVALNHRWLTLLACILVCIGGILIYRTLPSDFLPEFDEGGFVIDYWAPPGTSLAETSRQLNQSEAILRAMPEVESYSRRLGTEMGLFITEPNRGDFAVKLKTNRKHTTQEVIGELRHAFAERFPTMRWEFPGILSDVVGDLQLTPTPIEIKLFSPDLGWLKKTAPRVEDVIKKIPGVVDTFDGFTKTGPSFRFVVRAVEAARFGLSAQDISDAASTALGGQIVSTFLKGDRVVNIRLRVETNAINQIDGLRSLMIRTAKDSYIRLDQVCDVLVEPTEVELDRDNLRQTVTVTARLEGRDLGSAMREIRATLAREDWLPPSAVEYGGLYQQQQDSFRNLIGVLLTATLLVFVVLLLVFRSFCEPVAIVFGAVLALFGTVAALALTGATLNIVSMLGAIIGIGLVAKNGILMLDHVRLLEVEGVGVAEALVQSGHRRLRPVLMTSLAAALGMLPLALGIGAGADLLRPLAIAIIGALCISVVLSLVATPAAYLALRKINTNG